MAVTSLSFRKSAFWSTRWICLSWLIVDFLVNKREEACPVIIFNRYAISSTHAVSKFSWVITLKRCRVCSRKCTHGKIDGTWSSYGVAFPCLKRFEIFQAWSLNSANQLIITQLQLVCKCGPLGTFAETCFSALCNRFCFLCAFRISMRGNAGITREICRMLSVSSRPCRPALTSMSASQGEYESIIRSF